MALLKLMKSSLDSLERRGHPVWNRMEHPRRESPTQARRMCISKDGEGSHYPYTSGTLALSPKVIEISRGKAWAKGMDLSMRRWGGLLSQMVEDSHDRPLQSTSLQLSSDPRERWSQLRRSVPWAEQD